MPQRESPLTMEDYEGIKLNLQLAQDAEKEIAKAERAGLDVSDQKGKVQELKSRLLQIGRAYFPGKPLAP